MENAVTGRLGCNNEFSEGFTESGPVTLLHPSEKR
jgi:hypothetical protein